MRLWEPGMQNYESDIAYTNKRVEPWVGPPLTLVILMYLESLIRVHCI